MIINHYTYKPYWSVFLLLIGYILIALYFFIFLHYNFLQSDVLEYWQDSLSWRTPYHPFHVPVYPLIIAALRGITFGILPPLVIMMGINLVALLVGALFVYRIIQAASAKPEFAAMGALLFGLWPFIGLTYAVNPQADVPAMAFFLVGVNRLQSSCRLSAALFFGLSIVTHKALWPFIGLIIVADFLYRKEYVSKQNFWVLGIMFLPLGILWFAGSIHHHFYAWLWSSNLQEELATTSNSLPVLDGLLGTFLFEGGIKAGVKGLLLLSFALLAVGAIVSGFKLKYKDYFYGIAISIAALLLFIMLNHFEIWAAARFSRLLVVPLVLTAAKLEQINLSKHYFKLFAGLLLLLFLSQFVYAWYMARVFFTPKLTLGSQIQSVKYLSPVAPHNQYNYAVLKPIISL